MVICGTRFCVAIFLLIQKYGGILILLSTTGKIFRISNKKGRQKFVGHHRLQPTYDLNIY